MTADKRTRAELQAELGLVEADADSLTDALLKRHDAEIRRLRDLLDGRTPEAKAVDLCVKALDALAKADDLRRDARGRNYSTPMYTSHIGGGGYEEIQPLDAVAQVLTYLRVRFGHLDSQGEIQHLKQRVNTLLNENGRLREQLAQIAQSAGQK